LIARRFAVCVVAVGAIAAACSGSSSDHVSRATTTTGVVLRRIDADVARLQHDDDPTFVPAHTSESDFHIQTGPSPQQPVADPNVRAELATQLQEAREFAIAHPTLRDAEAAGYRPQDFVDGDGVHATNWDLVTNHFDAAHPSMVIYENTKPSARIVALSYVVESIGHQPAGFAGPNDRWHQHFGICIRRGILVQSAFKNRPKCAAISGRYLSGSTLWMLHTWVVPGLQNPWGVFAILNPRHTAFGVPTTTSPSTSTTTAP
jgi:hypothetical protein